MKIKYCEKIIEILIKKVFKTEIVCYNTLMYVCSHFMA